MKYLHTMVRVTDLKKSLHFYVEGLGFKVVRQNDYEKTDSPWPFFARPMAFVDDPDGYEIELLGGE